MHHPLPPEIIRQIFTSASSDTSVIPSLCLVCRAAYDWMIPALYNKITISDFNRLGAFLKLIDLLKTCPSRQAFLASHIHALWIGDTDYSSYRVYQHRFDCYTDDIFYVLRFCKHLRILALPAINHEYKEIITFPATLENLTVGTMSGMYPRFDSRLLPSLQSFTLIDLTMDRAKVADNAFPNLCHLRYILTRRWPYYAFLYYTLEWVSMNKTLQTVEVLCYGDAEHECLRKFEKVVQENASSPNRQAYRGFIRRKSERKLA